VLPPLSTTETLTIMEGLLTKVTTWTTRATLTVLSALVTVMVPAKLARAEKLMSVTIDKVIFFIESPFKNWLPGLQFEGIHTSQKQGMLWVFTFQRSS
jgi:uncharacterized protein YPO0396